MRISELPFKLGRAGHYGSWRSFDDYCHANGQVVRVVKHYDTRMITFLLDTGGSPVEVVDYSIGHGSVSDQNGMNKLFRAVGSDHYFSRQGGAKIS